MASKEACYNWSGQNKIAINPSIVIYAKITSHSVSASYLRDIS